MLADNCVHWHITPLVGIPQFNRLVIGACKDVGPTGDITATTNYTLMSLEIISENTLRNRFILANDTCQEARHFRSVRCHTLTSPSAEAEQRVEREEGCLDTQVKPSLWPSRLPRKGFANTRSSFTAFNARWYSRSASKGCSTGLLRVLLVSG